MILRYRVSLSGIKGFARVYELKSAMTLYEFHKVLREELDLPQDQLIQFKALDADGGLVARYGLFDLGKGAVDEVSLADTVAAGVASFTYFYDVTNRKSLIITFEGEIEAVPGTEYPLLVEKKGPNPIDFENGYVAYEDLPDEKRHSHENPSWAKEKDSDDDAALPLEDDADDVDADDDSEDEDEDQDDEDGKEIFDGTEELGF